MNRFKSIDIHQHLWPEPLIAALRARRRPPRLEGWSLELPGQLPFRVGAQDHDVSSRIEQARGDGLDLALISLSSALGIESLPSAEADELLAAWHEGALGFPRAGGREGGPSFLAWAAASLSDVDPSALEARLDEGFVGLQLPAHAIASRRAYDGVAPLLDVLQRRGAPLFVHPGPAAPVCAGAPEWWPAVVDYVSQMHAAWFAFRAHGRERHPNLRVVFALLAGLAPVHGERFAARAGSRSVVDELAFLETSSYDTRAIDAVVRAVGIDVIVAGSDRPYSAPASPDLGAAALHALRSVNPARLLGPDRLLQPKEVRGAIPDLACT